jgi:GABA(A) receptor-associated protein
MNFKQKYSFEQRYNESTKIMAKYPDRLPIICEKFSGSQAPNLDKNKFLVPNNIIVGEFITVIRKRIKLQPEEAIFIFVNGVLPNTSSLVSSIYQNHKDEDNFLYITYSSENTFGNHKFIL